MGDSFANRITTLWNECYSFVNEKLLRPQISTTKYKRQEWASRLHFLFSAIGSIVGLSNILVFPALAHENGGGAFYLVYTVIYILVGVPVLLLELSVGQNIGRGSTGVFKLFPAAEGVGYSMLFGNVLIGLTYICNIAYAIYYFFATMQSKLPWTWCRETWMDACCFIPNSKDLSLSVCDGNRSANFLCNSNKYCKCSGHTEFDFNANFCSSTIQEIARNASYSRMIQLSENCSLLQGCTNKTHSPAHFYYVRDVIHKSSHLDYLGSPIWHMSLCLLLSWIIVVLCTRKGIESFKKVIPFTALVPYGIIFLLYIKTAMLPGSGNGVTHLMKPDWSKLAVAKTWRLALSQVLFSLSAGIGVGMMYGSFCPLHQNLHMDVLLISSIDLVTSFMAGVLVFSTVGAMAHAKGLHLRDISRSGLQLAFVSYPEALSMLPAPHFWCLIYFALLFLLGFDSQLSVVVVTVTTILDEFPRMRTYMSEVTIGIGAITFLLGLPLVTPGGPILKDVVGVYGVVKPAMMLCFAELLVLIWMYGVKRFFDDLQWMIGYHPRPIYYWKGCLLVIAPIVILILAIYDISTLNQPIEMQPGVPIPLKVQVLGWFIWLAVVLPIPIYFVKNVWNAKGETVIQKIQAASKPTPEWIMFRKMRYRWTEENSHDRRRSGIHLTQAGSSENIGEASVRDDNPPVKDVTEDAIHSTSERTEDISMPNSRSERSKSNKPKRTKKRSKTTEET